MYWKYQKKAYSCKKSRHSGREALLLYVLYRLQPPVAAGNLSVGIGPGMGEDVMADLCSEHLIRADFQNES
jgi:hypothetical protein